jgi:hypothetical protein
MNDTVRTPVHLWIVGVIGLLWNGYGCYDYFMTQTNNAEYLASMGMTEAQSAYYETMPTWLEGAWAVGVWGALLGSLLLLLRNRWAVTAFALSLLGLALATLYQFVLTSPPEGMYTTFVFVAQALVWAGAIFFLLYAMRMRKAGVLR